MASNGTAVSGDDYSCDMKNQCLTVISISTFFGLLLICSCLAICYRCFWKEESVSVTTPLEAAAQQQQQPQQKPEIIDVAVDEDPT
jgi:hypothetical protein